jgi:hypothetical protein
MSSKNPVQNLASLKKLVASENDGRVALKVVDDIDSPRPKTRADCLPGGFNEHRPCPWYGCRHHLCLEVNPETGSLSVRDMDDVPHTCVLDVAEIGSPPGSGHGTPITLEEVGDILAVTRERARQLEVQALIRLKPGAGLAGLDPEQSADEWARNLEDEEFPNVNGHSATVVGKINGVDLAVHDDED